MSERCQFPQPMRDDLAMKLMAAWVGVPADKMPAEFRVHTTDHTRKAWARVAEAAMAHIDEDVLSALEALANAADGVLFGDCKASMVDEINEALEISARARARSASADGGE